jgi:hypothetical protein
VNRRSRPLRKWRLRGRRGQVAAVATILGLLLVVTFLANYLTATLPGQMSVNDLEHNVQVENQVGGLQALIAAAASQNAVGAQLSQPITLGSAGQPPFAGPDSGAIGPGNLSGGLNLTFTASNESAPVSVGPSVDGAPDSGQCPGAPRHSRDNCPSGTWFTMTVTPSVTNDLLIAAITVYQGATLNTGDVSDTAGSTWTLVAGGNALDGAYTQFVFWAVDTGVGSDTVTVGAAASLDASGVLFAIEGAQVGAEINTIGTFATGPASPASATVTAPANGLVVGIVSAASAGGFGGGGFPTITADSSGPSCTAPCTAIVQQDGYAEGVTFAEYAVASRAGTYTASATLSEDVDWGDQAISINPVPLTGPPPKPTLIPVAAGAQPPGASLVVHLRNTYDPTAEVAYDQGAVVFVQPGTVPIMLDPPAFSYDQTSMSLMIPRFVGTLPSESGLGTSDVTVRLVSVTTYQFPSSGLFLWSPSHVNLTLETPYWAAWMSFFNSNPSFSGTVSCEVGGAACPPLLSAVYESGGPMGRITISLPATSLDLTVATFSIGLS